MAPHWLQKTYWLFAITVFSLWSYELTLGLANGQLLEELPSSPAKIGKLVPALEVLTVDGKLTSKHSFQGKWKLVAFWASWCEPCQREMPTVDRLARKMKSSGLEVLAVCVEKSWAGARKYLNTHPWFKKEKRTMRLFLDPKRTNAMRYGTIKFPETYLIDPQGRLRYKWIGPYQFDSSKVVAQIKHVMRSF